MSEMLEKILRKHGIKGNEIDLGELLELLAKAHGDYERKEHPDCYDDDAYSYDDYYSAGGKTDEINHPAHYNDGIECIDYIESHHMNFNRGNAIKYATRDTGLRFKQDTGAAGRL